MPVPTRKSLKPVSRPEYPPILREPLADGVLPESKLPALLIALRVQTYKEGVVAMLIGHVIGHRTRKWGYPVELHGKPKKGAPAEDRLPLVLSHLGVSSYREALLRLAERHVPGFRKKAVTNAGRKGSLTKRGFDQEAFEAETVDEYLDRAEEARKQRKKLSQLQWPRTVCAAAAKHPDDPLYRMTPAQLVALLKRRERRESRVEKKSEVRVHKLRAVAGLPPLKRKNKN